VPPEVIIVVDDGSTDATASLAGGLDPSVKVLQREHAGLGPARTAGVAAATSEFIAFLDADDVWHPNKLARQVSVLERAPKSALCYTYARYIDPEGNPLKAERHVGAREGYILPQLIRGNFIPVSSVVVRRSALDTVGMFDIDSRLIGSEDWDLWLRIAAAFPVRLVPEELTLYRIHHTPRSHRVMLNGAIAVVKKRFSNPEFGGKAHITERKAEAQAYMSSAGFASPALARSERLKLLLRGISIAPTSILSSSGLLAFARAALPSSMIALLKRAAS